MSFLNRRSWAKALKEGLQAIFFNSIFMRVLRFDMEAMTVDWLACRVETDRSLVLICQKISRYAAFCGLSEMLLELLTFGYLIQVPETKSKPCPARR